MHCMQLGLCPSYVAYKLVKNSVQIVFIILESFAQPLRTSPNPYGIFPHEKIQCVYLLCILQMEFKYQ